MRICETSDVVTREPGESRTRCTAATMFPSTSAQGMLELPAANAAPPRAPSRVA